MGLFYKLIRMLCVTDEDLVPVLVGVCEVESRVVDAVLGRDQPVLGDHGGSAAPASDLYSLQVTIYFALFDLYHLQVTIYFRATNK